jgi:hypothetical protein
MRDPVDRWPDIAAALAENELSTLLTETVVATAEGTGLSPHDLIIFLRRGITKAQP